MLPNASSVLTPSENYARIRNPQLLFSIRAVAITLFATWIVLGLLNLPADFQIYRLDLLSQITWLKDLTSLGISIDVGIVYHWAFHILQVVIITAVGLLIFFKRSDDWYAILFSLCLTVSGIGNINYATDFQSPIISFSEITIVLCLWLPVFPILCLFPNGRFIPRWSRWLVVPSAIIVLPNILIKFGYWQVDARLSIAFYFLMALSWCFGIFLLLLRLRQTTNLIHRQQIKILFSGVFGAIVVVCFGKVLPLIPVLGSSALITLILDPLIYYGGQIGFAILMTFSMLRYHLWDIDLVLNRSSIYVGLAIVLIIIFSSALLLLQAGLQVVLGSQQTIVAAMISAGVVVGAFNPVRWRLQQILDWQLFGGQIDPKRIFILDNKPKAAAQLSLMRTDNLIGQQLAGYEINDLLGRGGMGEVYLGTHTILKHQVAVKVLLPHLATNPEFRTRFEREASIVANLHHPNIITTLAFGENSGLYYMVMDYIQGPDLGAFLKSRQALSLAEALPLIAKIASALDYAHAQGVVHRDIKPSNIMLQQLASSLEEHHPILMDFGLTKLVDSNSGFTQSGPLGTLAYMAPEQISAAHEADYRADIYAFGVMCYQMLTGKLPFSSNNQAALLFAHLHKPAPDPRLIQPELSLPASSAILRALDKLPANRPQSAGLFVAELSAIS